MNYCSNCRSELEDDAVFCPNCGMSCANGARRANGQRNYGQRQANNTMARPRNTMGGPGTAFQNQIPPQYGRDEDVFVDPNESIISRVGGGWLLNLAMVGSIQRVNGILTDKRCYLQGKLWEKNLREIKFESIINVEDINATYFRYERQLSYLIWAIVCCVLVVFIPVGLFMFWKYYKSKVTLFVIEYPGGTIEFEVYAADFAQVQMFGKEIHRVKEYARANLRHDLAERLSYNG